MNAYYQAASNALTPGAPPGFGAPWPSPGLIGATTAGWPEFMPPTAPPGAYPLPPTATMTHPSRPAAPTPVSPTTAPALDPVMAAQMQRALKQDAANQDAWTPTEAAQNQTPEDASGSEGFLDAMTSQFKGMTPWHAGIATAVGLGSVVGLEHLMAPGVNGSYDRVARLAGKVDRLWGVRHMSDLLDKSVAQPLRRHGAAGGGQILQSLLHQLTPAQEEARILRSLTSGLKKRVDPAAFAKFSQAATVADLRTLIEAIPNKDPLRKQLGAFIKRFEFLSTNHIPAYARRYHAHQTLLKKGVGPIGRILAGVVETLRQVASGGTMGLGRLAGASTLFAALGLGLMNFGPAFAKASQADGLWDGVKTFAHEFMGGIMGNLLGWQVGRYFLDRTGIVQKVLGGWSSKTIFRLPFTQFGRLSLAGFVTEIIAMFVFSPQIQSGFEWLSHKIFGKPKSVINEERKAQGLEPMPGNGLTHPSGFNAFGQPAGGNPAAAGLSESRAGVSGPSPAAADAGEDVSWMKRNPWATQDDAKLKELEASLPKVSV